ncbi:MAG: UDP-N-acetylenolpyruvoylglucosamine reductase [Ignavibacteria bacterium RIFCSPLOWO2_02_FULL_55_14]|nr:MAG: UDP-N-acetylenolpyruvoylglucosamine reductase [Ignavibacteria bacterium RIFCSPLOWO2_02_FULL_55_14]
MFSVDEIRRFFRGRIALDEPLAKFTWMKVGGRADCYLEPADKQDLIEIVRYVRQHDIPFMMLGRGSNVLVSDAGIRGVVINLEQGLTKIEVASGEVSAEAGVRITKFVDVCVQNGFAGVEMLAGIPGTVGGGVVMNAGAHGGEIADHLVDVEIMQGVDVVRVPKAECGFRYRHSKFEGEVVLSARFRLPAGDTETLIQRRKKLIQLRNASQPLELPNLGSMFKNPPGNFAARLIEQAGLKGKQIGNAQISEKHANFMVNRGGATAADVMRLIDLVQRTVYQNSGVRLELEVKLVGFQHEEQAA